MFSSSRLPTGLKVSCLALVLLIVPHALAHAKKATASPSSSSVEIYVDQALPAAPGEGVLPEGVTWNKPLKAGDLVLQRKLPKKQERQPVLAPKVQLPVGELKAPVLPASKSAAKPPQITAKTGSTANVMLMQGMKNALQQAGQNPDIPKSEIKAQEETLVLEAPVAKTEAPTLQLQPPQMVSGEETSLLAPVAETDASYEPGRGPKTLAPPKNAAPAATPEIVVDEGKSEIVFPPEMTELSAPKATEIQAAPNSLASTVKAEEKVLAAPLPSAKELPPVETGASIFGKPVEDTPPELFADEEPAKAAPAQSVAVASGSCSPSVMKWSRDCQDAGYPSSFVGEIVGETRVVCPSGDAREVWLSNSCAEGQAGSFQQARSQAAASETSSIISAPRRPSVEVADPAAVAAPTPPVQNMDNMAVVDASCGVANGLASLTAPISELCSLGEATPLRGEGPWRWSCMGRNGGMTVSCAAPVAPKTESKATSSLKTDVAARETSIEDGKCGPAIEGGHDFAPEQGLCLKGTASRVSGSGPWTWACSGLNGGQAAACTSAKKTEGACGSASREGSEGMPMRDLCASGYASAVTGNGPWNWTCSGLHGGGAATCAAQPKVNAVCGSASTTGQRQAPTSGLCASGKPSAVQGNGPWLWSCQGERGGAAVSCQANALTDGVCGSANGSQFESAPDQGLCDQGRSSRVTGLGPWNWTCAGEDGGNTVSCTAALGSKEAIANIVACGEAAETLSLFKPSDKLCVSGKASEVSGNGPWSWTCSDDVGHTTKCNTLTASAGSCGKASGVSSSATPSANLCADGTPSEVVSSHTKMEWRWECKGAMGSSSASCSAPITKGSIAAKAPEPQAPLVACGSAAERGVTSAPSGSDLCSAGKPSAVRGNGPWNWTCATSGKNAAKVSCEAQKIADGSCGSANGSIQKSAPLSGLCASGAATEVSGEGPWMWSCVGTGGGNSASCSALAQSQTKVDGTCGIAANAAMNAPPSANLCDSGVPSTVYGEGPWTWTCSGMNGGIASTCSTTKVVPKAPPPPGPLVNGLCGSSNGVAVLETPEGGLCSAGTATAISGEGPWNWSCIGGNGGMTVSCTAPLMPPAPIVGACGASSGVPTLTAPKSALCAAGISSAVSGKGPWTWSCSGTNGGGAVSCVAPMAGSSGANAPLPSLATPSLDNGVAPAPSAAPAGLVTPTLPSGPLPPLKGNTIPNRKTSKKGELPKEASALPAAPLLDSKVPLEAPSLPSGTEPLNPPPVRDTLKPTPGLKPPVIDSEGKPVPGARISLDSDVSTIDFDRRTDQLDKEGIDTVNKLANILLINPQVRITLIAYSDTGTDLPPREARRLSLNRALTIRDVLASKGVASSRVDVRPMGSNVPSGDMDRVDVKVN